VKIFLVQILLDPSPPTIRRFATCTCDQLGEEGLKARLTLSSLNFGHKRIGTCGVGMGSSLNDRSSQYYAYIMGETWSPRSFVTGWLGETWL